MDGRFEDEEELWAPRRRRVWPAIVLALAGLALAIAVFTAWSRVEPRGVTVRGRGHVVVLPDQPAWVFLSEGQLFAATDESTTTLDLRSGPCTHLAGFMRDDHLHLEEADCAPGSLQLTIADRLRAMGLKVAYWPANVRRGEDDVLAPHLETVELAAAMVDPRFDDPQLVPLYRELFPGPMVQQRAAGRLPPPVVIQVRRNDRVGKRMTRTELGQWLHRDRLVLAAAAEEGGWLVREVRLTPAAREHVGTLLTAPGEGPWPGRLEAGLVEAGPWPGGAGLPSSGTPAGDPRRGGETPEGVP